MAEKKIKTRIQQKHDIEANWIKATTFVPMAGEIIVYDAETSSTDLTDTGRTSPIGYERFKIGDGTSAVTALPFATNPHTHTVTHTPAGTVSAPKFTGSSATTSDPSATADVAAYNHTHTVTGTVSQPTFTGTAASHDHSFTGSAVTSGGTTATMGGSAIANKRLTITQSSHTHSVTAAGTVGSKSITPAGTVSQPTFSSGSAAANSAKVTVASGTHTHTVTAKGSNSAPTFTGTSATLTTSSGS